ncbi:MAG: sugar phosphate isomerase/epimerase, partial [Endomicrobia bacterium]|nr:sugar phosphate isomerase/epimerase [Endomicrobiia bacterium]
MDASIQLYSLRDSGANLRQQLERVAKIGYKGVEFCGYEDISANEMKALLAGHGLTPTGTHVGPDIFFGDIDGQIEYCAETGIKYLILPWADLNRAEDIKKVAEILNSASEKAKKSGVVVGYHNHAHEFNKIGGEYILDLLFKSLEKDVIMQLDLYWIRLTGIDPVDYINKHADVCR